MLMLRLVEAFFLVKVDVWWHLGEDAVRLSSEQRSIGSNGIGFADMAGFEDAHRCLEAKPSLNPIIFPSSIVNGRFGRRGLERRPGFHYEALRYRR